MAALAVLGARHLRDEEVPQVALLTAAYFVASAVHLPIGPTTIHLLLNGLVGVLLGWRACLAIPLGILLQYLLLQHGGFYTIGINSCIQIIPALAAAAVFSYFWRRSWWRRPAFRSALIAVCCLAGLASILYSVCLLSTNFLADSLDPHRANEVMRHPGTLAGLVLASAAAVVLERRLHYATEFALGLLIGELTVLATVGLNIAVLLAGGERFWREPILLEMVAAVPLAVIEGLVVGSTVAFLARVKPEMLGNDDGGSLLVPTASAVNGVLARSSDENRSMAPPLPCPGEPVGASAPESGGRGPSA
jgi:ABC-type Co2+ transport system permease subunit